MALVALIGAGLTALGFYIGTKAWGYLVLALFVATLLAGLALKFGVQRFAVATLLNVWFLICLAIPAGLKSALPTKLAGRLGVHEWNQALAWLIGGAAWITFTFVVWLVSGLKHRPHGAMTIPGDGAAGIKLTRGVVVFVVIRAMAVAGSAAIAFGLHEPNADWMPIATLISIKPSLEQSHLAARQRLVGATLGALIAIPFLLAINDKNALEIIVIVLASIAVTIHDVNYAYYTAAVAGAALIALDLPNPSNYGAEGRRVLFTAIGVAIGVGVTLIVDRLQKRTASASGPAQPAPAS